MRVNELLPTSSATNAASSSIMRHFTAIYGLFAVWPCEEGEVGGDPDVQARLGQACSLFLFSERDGQVRIGMSNELVEVLTCLFGNNDPL